MAEILKKKKKSEKHKEPRSLGSSLGSMRNSNTVIVAQGIGVRESVVF